MISKEQLIKSIESLPDEVTVDEMIDRIILLDKIEQGLRDVEAGNVYTTEEVKERLEKWLK